MIIKKMKASFGSLKGDSLELKNGLNVVTAPNEAGKSTWMAFIRTMFYGIDSSQRDKGGVLADKNRYRPWSGAPMEGTMLIEHMGREIALTRGTAAASAPMRKFSAVYADTGDDVLDISSESAGLRLLGVEQEVFRRSCYIGQKAVGVDHSPELERRIQSLVTSGDESTSYSDANEKLKAWERRINYARSGELLKINAQIEDVENKLRRQQEMNRASGELRSRIRRLSEAKAELEKEVEISEKYSRAKEINARYEAAQRRERALAEKKAADEAFSAYARIPLKSEITGSLDALKSWRENEKRQLIESEGVEALRQSEKEALSGVSAFGENFSGITADEAWDKAKENSTLASVFLSKSRRSMGLVLGTVLAVLGAVGAFAFFSYSKLFTYICRGLLAAGVIIVAVSLTQRRKFSRKYLALLAENNAKTVEEMLEKAKAYGEKAADAQNAAQRRAIQEELIEKLRIESRNALSRAAAAVPVENRENLSPEEIERIDNELLQLMERQSEAGSELREAEKVCAALGEYNGEELVDISTLPRANMDRDHALTELAETRMQLENCAKELAMKDGAVIEIGDPAYLTARLEELKERREELQLRLEALQGAQEVLREADQKVRARFSPLLNKRAGEILGRLTNGRYDTLMLDREFSAQAVPEGDALARDMAYLSGGTVDQIYLAVRLAVCDLVLGGEREAPIILDDALVYFDDERMKAALDTLMEYAGKRQVILFSCSGREAEYLEGKDGVNVVRL